MAVLGIIFHLNWRKMGQQNLESWLNLLDPHKHKFIIKLLSNQKVGNPLQLSQLQYFCFSFVYTFFCKLGLQLSFIKMNMWERMYDRKRRRETLSFPFTCWPSQHRNGSLPLLLFLAAPCFIGFQNQEAGRNLLLRSGPDPGLCLGGPPPLSFWIPPSPSFSNWLGSFCFHSYYNFIISIFLFI